MNESIYVNITRDGCACALGSNYVFDATYYKPYHYTLDSFVKFYYVNNCPYKLVCLEEVINYFKDMIDENV